MGDFLSPVLFPGAYISSDIGSRVPPTAGASSFHKGVDIAVPYGTSVYAPTDLTISRAGNVSGFGKAVYGVDSLGNTYVFGDLASVDVAPGATIAQGTTLGTAGYTGPGSTGSHLHFGILDKAGNVLSDLTHKAVAGIGKDALAKGKDVLKKAGEAFLLTNPVTAPFAIGAKALGLDSDCGIVCQVKKWFNETDFFKRVAFVVLGFILISGAIVFFAKGEGSRIIKENLS